MLKEARVAGFFARLFGIEKSRPPSDPAPLARPASATSTDLIGRGWDDMEVSGEAYYRGGLRKVFHALGRPEGGVTMQMAHLIPDPKNRYDANAVRVVVLGEQLGHVPAEESSRVSRACRAVARGSVAVVPARIWARNDDGTWRGRVTLMFSGEAAREEDYAADRLEWEQRHADAAQRAADREVRDAARAAQRAAGVVDGQHWALLKPVVAELKRQKRFEEARDLLARCVDAAEKEAAVAEGIPNPWPSEQMSVVLRRLRAYPDELVYLERYVTACGAREVPESVLARLSRSRLAVAGEA